MTYRLYEIKLTLDYNGQQVFNAILQATGLKEEDIESYKIIRRSLDARKAPKYNLLIEFECKDNIALHQTAHIKLHEPSELPIQTHFVKNYQGRPPVVIGAGPAGLMAALVLAENGMSPIIFERGGDTAARSGQIKRFIKTGELNINSNMLYGEGGAGLFSDGKLTARSKKRHTMQYFFQTLIDCGAPNSILIDAEPHLGSDVLLKIIPNLRKKIIAKGGTIHFNSYVSNIVTENGNAAAVIVNGDIIPTSHCVVATGHSARDVYTFLSDTNVALEEKPFAMGVRIEMPQELVNRAQYGEFMDHPLLGAASFKLTRKPEKNYRACYSFCMCPGGEVIPCASSEGMLTTNGMSWSKRDGYMANAAFLAPVRVEDYQDFFRTDYPKLAGCFFQEYYEKCVFEAGGSDYSIPAARLSEFLTNEGSSAISSHTSCKRYKPASISAILPAYINETLIYSIPKMLSQFGKINYHDVNVFCAETRSSTPVRIVRDSESLMSTNTQGLYPCGEGAGYAGGIVSSAIDGIRVAESILKSVT